MVGDKLMKDLDFWENINEEIIDTDDEDIIVTNREGIIVKVTNLSGSLYGWNKEDLLGKSVYDLEEKGVFSPAITPLVLNKQKKVITVQTTSDGRKILITGIPLFNENHEIDYVLSYSYEMSELILLQEYLDELNEEMSKVKTELAYLRESSLKIDNFIAESQFMNELFRKVKKVTPHDVTILLHGEPGTGKTKLAKFIHKNSVRKEGPFIEVNCSSLPDVIFENELFGEHSDQAREKTGLLDMAKSGTLYLEGVNQLSLQSQHTLLKALKKYNGEFRIIVSTEESLKKLMKEKKFREDLFYELYVVSLYILPLRERIEDLAVAIEQYKNRFCEKYQLHKKISKELYMALLDLKWTGNFMEIKNVMERMIVQSESDILTVDDLPYEYRSDQTVESFKLNGDPLNTVLENVEKQIIQDVKKYCKTTTEMAEVLGISQPSVVRKLKKYSI